MKYQALSVVKPAGARIADGRKSVEVRRWRPEELPLKDLVIVQNECRLSSNGLTEDPDGIALALVDVVSCTEWTEDLFDSSCASYWEPGWLAWHLDNVRPLATASLVPAKLRIYDIDLPEHQTNKG